MHEEILLEGEQFKCDKPLVTNLLSSSDTCFLSLFSFLKKVNDERTIFSPFQYPINIGKRQYLCFGFQFFVKQL